MMMTTSTSYGLHPGFMVRVRFHDLEPRDPDLDGLDDLDPRDDPAEDDAVTDDEPDGGEG